MEGLLGDWNFKNRVPDKDLFGLTSVPESYRWTRGEVGTVRREEGNSRSICLAMNIKRFPFYPRVGNKETYSTSKIDLISWN